jgi:ABC-2 type transport system permease protein
MQGSLIYRTRYIISTLTGLVQIGILFFLWRAFYLNTNEVAGYTWSHIRTYLFLTYLLNLLITFYTELRISQSIRVGNIALELIKPIDYQWARFAEATGTALVEGVVVGAGATLVAIALFQILPPELSNLFWLPFSLLAAFVLKFLMAYIVGILCFWTTNAVGLIFARITITNFFSGGLVPLALLPGWLKTIALYLPFQGMLHTPVSLYLGRITDAQAIRAIIVQYIWILALWFIARILFNRGVRTVTIQGG